MGRHLCICPHFWLASAIPIYNACLGITCNWVLLVVEAVEGHIGLTCICPHGQAGEGTPWEFRREVGDDKLCYLGWTGLRFKKAVRHFLALLRTSRPVRGAFISQAFLFCWSNVLLDFSLSTTPGSTPPRRVLSHASYLASPALCLWHPKHSQAPQPSAGRCQMSSKTSRLCSNLQGWCRRE